MAARVARRARRRRSHASRPRVASASHVAEPRLAAATESAALVEWTARASAGTLRAASSSARIVRTINGTLCGCRRRRDALSLRQRVVLQERRCAALGAGTRRPRDDAFIRCARAAASAGGCGPATVPSAAIDVFAAMEVFVSMEANTAMVVFAAMAWPAPTVSGGGATGIEPFGNARTAPPDQLSSARKPSTARHRPTSIASASPAGFALQLTPRPQPPPLADP